MLQPTILRIGTRCSCSALFLLHANTYEIIQSEYSREFFKNNFRPFAAASKCRPVRPAPLVPPRYASKNKSVSSLVPRLSTWHCPLLLLCMIYVFGVFCLSFQHLRLLFVVFTNKEIIRGRLHQIPIDIS